MSTHKDVGVKQRPLWVMALLLVSSGLLTSGTSVAHRVRPVHIGVLTASWGPTSQVVGLRDGLLKLGYHEHEDFELGVRFTQGQVAPLEASRVV